MTRLAQLSQPELAVLAALRRAPMTRLQLAERLALSASSVSRLLGPMLHQKLILEVDGPTAHGAGRPALALEASPKVAVGIGSLRLGPRSSA
jgi:predicted transcriptional regulator